MNTFRSETLLDLTRTLLNLNGQYDVTDRNDLLILTYFTVTELRRLIVQGVELPVYLADFLHTYFDRGLWNDITTEQYYNFLIEADEFLTLYQV